MFVRLGSNTRQKTVGQTIHWTRYSIDPVLINESVCRNIQKKGVSIISNIIYSKINECRREKPAKA